MSCCLTARAPTGRRWYVPTTAGRTNWTAGCAGRPGWGRTSIEAGFGLVELPVVDWHGWLFVNADGAAVPFAEHIGELERHVAPYQPRRLVVKATHRYQVAANWKLIAENYHECYHCPSDPSGTVRGDHPPVPAKLGVSRRAWVGGSMVLRDHAHTMSLDGASHGIALPDVDTRTVQYLGLFPNLLLSLHPDYVMTHRMTPLTPGTTLVECEWLFDEAGGGSDARGRVLGYHQPTGLGRLRVRPARGRFAALPARPAGPERERGLRLGPAGGPRLSGPATVDSGRTTPR